MRKKDLYIHHKTVFIFNRRVFLDALFRAGTGDAIEVSIDLLNSKELNILEQRLALISLATVRHATSNSIKATIVR